MVQKGVFRFESKVFENLEMLHENRISENGLSGIYVKHFEHLVELALYTSSLLFCLYLTSANSFGSTRG